jgi:hypothetical protein
VSVLACVNPAGYGFNGSVAEQCPKGTYNAADTYGNCTACPPGFTTAGPGAGATQADCTNRTGNGTMRPCPIGGCTSGLHVLPCSGCCYVNRLNGYACARLRYLYDAQEALYAAAMHTYLCRMYRRTHTV